MKGRERLDGRADITSTSQDGQRCMRNARVEVNQALVFTRTAGCVGPGPR